jgi:AraC-like DNA-binding protein
MSTQKDTLGRWQMAAFAARFSATIMADGFGISEKELRKYFRRGLGVSLGEWLIERRYIEAARLIARGMPLKAVADIVGIKNVSHLTRGFEAFYGVSPRTFRQDPARFLPHSTNGKRKKRLVDVTSSNKRASRKR